jgi:hypothetical protein
VPVDPGLDVGDHPLFADVVEEVVVVPFIERVYLLSWASRAPRSSVHVENPQIAGDAWRLDPATGGGPHDESAMVVSTGCAPSSPKAVSFKSWDGETIHGLLYLPYAVI